MISFPDDILLAVMDFAGVNVVRKLHLCSHRFKTLGRKWMRRRESGWGAPSSQGFCEVGVTFDDAMLKGMSPKGQSRYAHCSAVVDR
jgi:hypothetical protein